MISSGSYELSTFSTGMKAEMKRLNSQIDLFWSKECLLYNKWGLSNGLRIVDLGCGTGHLIDKLSKEFPMSKFTGVEQDPLLVDVARQHLQNNSAVELISSSVEEYNPQSKSFDIAIMRLVLEHVPDPFLVLKHIHSMLKPEGRIIVIDNDFDYHLCTYPDIPELKDLYKAYRQSRIQDGGDPCIGRHLPRLLKNAGFHNIDMDILSAHSQIIGDLSFLSSEGAGIPTQLTKSGFLQENILHSLVKKWRDMLNTPDHCLFRQLFAATGFAQLSQLSDSCAHADSMLSKNRCTMSADPQYYRQFLSNVVSQILNVNIDDLDENISLIDAGLDSVGALDTQIAIQEAFNVELSISSLLGGTTFLQVTDILKQKIDRRSEIAKDHSKSSDTEESGTL